MSLDLAVLTPANAASVEQARAIYVEETVGTPDDSGQLEAYAREVYDAYTDDDWPFAGGPDIEGGCCAASQWRGTHGRGAEARRARTPAGL